MWGSAPFVRRYQGSSILLRDEIANRKVGLYCRCVVKDYGRIAASGPSRKGDAEVDSGPRRNSPWTFYAALHGRVAIPSIRQGLTEPNSCENCRRRSIARLFLGAGKVLPFDNGSQGPRPSIGSTRFARGCFLSSRVPRRGLLHRLLSREGSDSDISGSNVRARLFWASCLSKEAGRESQRTEERSIHSITKA